MLVLSRKANETIVLDNAIEVTVLEILGERVKIGINAPRDVPIVRQELLHQNRSNHSSSEPAAAGAGESATGPRSTRDRHP